MVKGSMAIATPISGGVYSKGGHEKPNGNVLSSLGTLNHWIHGAPNATLCTTSQKCIVASGVRDLKWDKLITSQNPNTNATSNASQKPGNAKNKSMVQLVQFSRPSVFSSSKSYSRKPFGGILQPLVSFGCNAKSNDLASWRCSSALGTNVNSRGTTQSGCFVQI